MDHILDHYESDSESSRSSFNKSQEIKYDANSSFQRQISGTSEDIDDDADKDFEEVAQAIEDSLLKADADAEMEDGGEGSSVDTEAAKAKHESSDENASADDASSVTDNEVKTNGPSEANTHNDDPSDILSFEEDIILPDPRRDLEKEQKERDRQKRKEMRSRKEMEEEERERMQYVL